MNIRAFATAAATLGLLATASAARAAITVNALVLDDLTGLSLAANNQTMLLDFDDIANPNVSYAGNEVTTPPDALSLSTPPSWSSGVVVVGAPNRVDPTDYASVGPSSIGTFSMLNGWVLSSFSFYMGSPDGFNKLTFNMADGASESFVGKDIWGSAPSETGDRTQGYRVYYDFGGALVTSIDFESSQDAFEFDGLAGNAVPEPGAWTLMILGFGVAGVAIRRRRFATA